MHDVDFRSAERDWHSFVEKLTDRLIESDDTIPELPVKDVVGATSLSNAETALLIKCCRSIEYTGTCASVLTLRPIK